MQFVEWVNKFIKREINLLRKSEDVFLSLCISLISFIGFLGFYIEDGNIISNFLNEYIGDTWGKYILLYLGIGCFYIYINESLEKNLSIFRYKFSIRIRNYVEIIQRPGDYNCFHFLNVSLLGVIGYWQFDNINTKYLCLIICLLFLESVKEKILNFFIGIIFILKGYYLLHFYNNNRLIEAINLIIISVGMLKIVLIFVSDYYHEYNHSINFEKMRTHICMLSFALVSFLFYQINWIGYIIIILLIFSIIDGYFVNWIKVKIDTKRINRLIIWESKKEFTKPILYVSSYNKDAVTYFQDKIRFHINLFLNRNFIYFGSKFLPVSKRYADHARLQLAKLCDIYIALYGNLYVGRDKCSIMEKEIEQIMESNKTARVFIYIRDDEDGGTKYMENLQKDFVHKIKMCSSDNVKIHTFSYKQHGQWSLLEKIKKDLQYILYFDQEFKKRFETLETLEYIDEEIEKIVREKIELESVNLDLLKRIEKGETIVDRKSDISIFISYVREDLDKVSPIYNSLINRGFNAWLDVDKLLPGENWKSVIHKQIKKSHIVIACLSEKSVKKKGYFQKELKDSLEEFKEYPEGSIYIIPVRLEPCEVPIAFENIQWCNLFEDRGLENLIISIEKSIAKVIEPQ